MFGSEYSNNSEILFSSFSGMHGSYKKKAKKIRQNPLLKILFKIYTQTFGIPEIGFQIRSLYFNDIVSSRLSHKKFKSILDAGSGIGFYSFWLARKYPNAVIDGTDIDREKINFCKKLAENLNIQNTIFSFSDITKKPQKNGMYDFIVNIDVLEHVENYKKVIKNFEQLLKVNGYLYIHTPQPHQKRIFRELATWEHEGHIHEGYTPLDLKKTLTESGFKIIELRQSYGFFGKLAWELNHLSFRKNFFLAGVIFPILYMLAYLDLEFQNKNGLCTAILAQKR